MITLNCKTRGQSSPQGKERVYYTAHSKDFALYFEEITNDILKTQNCAIYSDSEPSIERALDEIKDELDRMQLIVIPITSEFLYKENRARCIEFQYAIEKNIPILPLMYESDLEDEFCRICGNIHFLDKNNVKYNSIPYDEKLKKYLEAVLLGDELSDKVRKAFDAYVFLSYRKKDRRYAQKLMEIIHKNDFCRDIAIWYDEYLVAGENFNQAIRDAMQKSALFALVVTPNLVNEKNYIMTTEYPEAVNANKPILPIEMEHTDRSELEQKFPNIPSSVSVYDDEAFVKALMGSLKNIVIAENDDDPEHLFFIGLAYLGGIDVEINHNKAVELITKSAKMEFPQAMEKLASMYRNGEGVSKDYKQSISWRKHLAEVYKTQYANGMIEIDLLLVTIINLGMDYQEIKDLDNAVSCNEQVITLCKDMCSSINGMYYSSLAYHHLGLIYREKDEINLALKSIEKSIDLQKYLNDEHRYSALQRNISLGYVQMADIYGLIKEYDKAEEMYKKSLTIQESLFTNTTFEERHQLSLIYGRMCNLYLDTYNVDMAYCYGEKGLSIAISLAREFNNVDSIHLLAGSYLRMGDVYTLKKSMLEAIKNFEKCIVIQKENVQAYGTFKNRKSLLFGYAKICDVYTEIGKLNDAQRCADMSLDIANSLVKEFGTNETWDDLASIYFRYGVIESKRNPSIFKRLFTNNNLMRQHFRRAYAIWSKLAAEYPDIKDYANKVQYVKSIL